MQVLHELLGLDLALHIYRHGPSTPLALVRYPSKAQDSRGYPWWNRCRLGTVQPFHSGYLFINLTSKAQTSQEGMIVSSRVGFGRQD